MAEGDNCVSILGHEVIGLQRLNHQKRTIMEGYRQAIKIIMLPRDTNALGSIFGGVILSNIDLAAAEHARHVAKRKFVTKVFKEVNFLEPVFVGDTVSFYTKTQSLGRTSITIAIEVVATRMMSTKDEDVHVTSAEVVMVAVDDARKPVPLFDSDSKFEE